MNLQERTHRFQTGNHAINLTVVNIDRNEDGKEFVIEVNDRFRNGFTRAQMHELHRALGEMLGLESRAPSSPKTASKPGKNPRRVNGGL